MSLQEKQHAPNVFRAVVSHCQVIRPGYQALISVRLTNRQSAFDTLLEPVCLRGGRIAVQAARTIVKAGNHHVHFPVANAGSEPITLMPGELVALAQPFSFSAYVVAPAQKTEDTDITGEKHHRHLFLEALSAAHLNPELTPEQLKAVKEMLWKHHKAFSLDGRLGNTNLLSMDINTGNAKPVPLTPYRASPREREAIKKEVQELMAQGIVEEFNSPWVAPVILVPKKDGGLRFYVDFRRLNAVTVADHYPLPRIDDLLSHLSGKSWFTSFDANKGSHQIPLTSEDDRAKTAFRTHLGLHQYTRMPFGVKNGPSIFQRLMDRLLGKRKWKMAVVYIDDLIISSKTFEEHLSHCSTILSLVISGGLTLSLKKSYLFFPKLTALGHSVSGLGIATLEDKTRTVAQWERPTTVKVLQKFLGLAVYYHMLHMLLSDLLNLCVYVSTSSFIGYIYVHLRM
ncbi:uncharacterized protein VTP21DRAFT_10270 [Calcarisporiella thermophila]|uniref:uncharacterized protein n=1 Tax=Calcarisporiella thermophila TaxID=911321 RepID=UPI0037435543